jgi:hypothetical protein
MDVLERKMKKYQFYSTLIYGLFLFSSLVFAQENQNDKFFDGPHIIYSKDSLIINYYNEGTTNTFYVKMEDRTPFHGFLQDSTESYVIPKQFDLIPDSYPDVEKIFVVSDIHGQYDIFQELLYSNKIIDQNNTWVWGDGHLVIIGDLFDKGTKVHESLWLIYRLEQQAKKAGGVVHFILGNHEVKALRGDLKYVRENYFTLAKALSITIPELYYDNTFWGRWLRSKNVLTKIGFRLFVHGGIHPDLIEKYSSISDINIIMKENLDLSLDEIKINPELSFLFRKDGPIRYRGFFQPDNLPEVSNCQLNDILNHFDVDRIIVGHTSGEHIYTSYNNQIVCVDSGIKNGLHGEALLIMDDRYYAVNTKGDRTPIF